MFAPGRAAGTGKGEGNLDRRVLLDSSPPPDVIVGHPIRRRKASPMDDSELVHRISQLTDEEHALERNEGEGISDEDVARLRSIEVALDQCWDLLRQRRALREFGQDPDKAKVRPAKIVENYEQ